MMFLPGLAVVFAGLLGHGGEVDKQVKSLVHDLHVKMVAVPASALKTLVHHADGTKDVVRKMHVDGVISCEIVKGHGAPTLRLVIYDGQGGLKTFTEMSLGAHGALAADDLDMLKSNLEDDVTALRGGEAEPETAPAPAPAPVVAKAPPKPAPVVKQQPAKVAETDIELDDEMPAGLGGKKSEPARAKPEPAPAEAPRPQQHAEQATTESADAVSADEIESLTSGGGTDDATAAPPTVAPSLHLGAAAGFGIASRAFTPTASTVAAYTSSPVAAMSLEAHVQPTAHTYLSVSTERTLQLTTPMHDGSVASTSISRWEAAGTYSMWQHGALEAGPRVGVGRRSFAIDSTDPSRSPDGDYNYLILGFAASARLGDHVALRGAASFEPVVSGTEPTEMTFGEATRWAIDLGAAVEVRPWSHVFARVAATYQRFTWSWDMAGARGAGGATDEYPSGSLQLGADY